MLLLFLNTDFFQRASLSCGHFYMISAPDVPTLLSLSGENIKSLELSKEIPAC